MPSVLQQTSSSLRAPVQSPLKKSLLTTLSTLPLRITFPSAGFLNPFSLTLPKASLYCILQVPFLGSSQHLPPHPSRTGPAVCAPNSNGPTITLYTSASRNQLPPRWLISHQGDHQGQKTPRCGHSWAPEAAQMHLHPVHSPEQGSSSSCSRESPGGLPTCLGFTSRSWSRARFFSWGGGRGRGAPESPAPSHAQRENKRTPGTGALLPGSTEKLGSQTAPTYRAFSCPHPAQHSPPGR